MMIRSSETSTPSLGRRIALAAAFLCSAGAKSNAAPSPVDTPAPLRPFVIGNSQLVDFRSAINGRDYQLAVHLPWTYASNPPRRYPVVYFTDGTWDFPLLVSLYGNGLFDGTIPDCILVGLTYSGTNPDYGNLRTRDYVPTGNAMPPGHVPDGAEGFLRVLEHEILPLVQSRWRVDTSFRVLQGSSLGGLFTLYAMFSRPGLFQAYVAVSPAITPDLVDSESAFHGSGRDLPGSLYLTAAEHEFPGDPRFLEKIQSFADSLRQHRYPHLRYQYRFLDDTRHASAKAEGYARGLQYSFRPLEGGCDDGRPSREPSSSEPCSNGR
jgi:predicted alpha/beta superfamily hydrolase